STRASSWTAASAALRKPSASSTSSSRRATGGTASSDSASSSSPLSLARVERRRCIACARSALRDEPVPDPTNRLDPAWLAQRPPHLVHRLLDAVLEPGVRGAPGPLQQLGSAHPLSRPFRQQVQRR